MLTKGKIVEQGTHSELLAKEGAYKKLVQHQLTSQAAEDETQLDPEMAAMLAEVKNRASMRLSVSAPGNQ